MNRFIPYEKLSKKEKKALNAKKRGSWGNCSPVTRKSPNPKAYNRKKARNWRDESNSVLFPLFACLPQKQREAVCRPLVAIHVILLKG